MKRLVDLNHAQNIKSAKRMARASTPFSAGGRVGQDSVTSGTGALMCFMSATHRLSSSTYAIFAATAILLR